MSYQDVKNMYESKVKAGYDAGCYVATFESNDKLTDVLCDALDASARKSLAYFDGTEFGAFAAFADYLHSEFNVPAEDCEFMYMMATKMQFKHMSHGGDLTEVLNSVKKSNGLDLFDKPKEEWTVIQKQFVMKLKHDEYYKAVLREIGLDTTPDEFWTKFGSMFRDRYADITAYYLHMYSTLPAMIPNMTDAEIPVSKNLSHHISTIHRTLVWLVKSGEMSIEPWVIIDPTIRKALLKNSVIRFAIHATKNMYSSDFSYENFKRIICSHRSLDRYILDLLKLILKRINESPKGDASLLLSMNGPRENVDYVLWPIYNTWRDMEAKNETRAIRKSDLNEMITFDQCKKDAVFMATRKMTFESI